MLYNILYFKIQKEKRAFTLLWGLLSYLRDHDIVIAKVLWVVVYRRSGKIKQWF